MIPMRTPCLGALVTVLFIAACARTRSAPAPDAAPRETAATSKWLGGFDALPDARPLCDEHVMAAPGAPPSGDTEPIREIHWLSFATTSSPRDVASFYASKGTPLDADQTHHLGRFVLSVHSVTDTTHPSCAEKPKPGEQSVIVVSQALP